MRKQWKIRGLEKALEDVPIEERFKVGAEIKRAFENFDPANPPGQPVVPLEPGTRVCPTCGGPLVEFAVIAAAGPSHPARRVLDCDACDASFSERVD